MNELFVNNNALTYICQYLDYKSIISFSQCNKKIYQFMDPDKNIIINIIYMLSVIKEFYQFDEDDDKIIIKNKKNLLDVFSNSMINWKNYLKEITLNFRFYEDKVINNKILDCFKIHIYLPDLRKENSYLEFESSSIHQTICYDIYKRNNITNIFYSNNITKEYLLEGLNNKNNINNNSKCINIIKEGLFFEKELINFSATFNDFINNKQYKDLIINCIVKYDYEKLYNIHIYKINNNNNNNCNIDYYNNNIIILILWINYSFMLYSKYAYEYINSLKDNLNEKTFLEEYIRKQNELINCGLILNSNLDNINIIINQFMKYFSIFEYIKDNEKNELKLSNVSLGSSTNSNSSTTSSTSSDNSNYNNFSLYNLFLVIIKKEFFDKLKERLTNKYKYIFKTFWENTFDNFDKINSDSEDNEGLLNDYNNINYNNLKPENNNNEDDDMNIEEEDEDYDDDEGIIEEKEATEKEVIENFFSGIADYEINEFNANVINHTEIKVSKEYENIENLFTNQFVTTLKNNIEEGKSLFSLFDIIEKNTKCKEDTRCLLTPSNSLNLIRRTKKHLMKDSCFVLFKYALVNIENDFLEHIKLNDENKRILYLTNEEIKNKTKYNCDLDELTDKNILKVSDKVKKEIENLKSYLIEQNVKTYDNEDVKKETIKLINEYIDYDGIEYVLLMKKIIWFYYKQLGIYEQRNNKIEKILNEKKGCYLPESCEPFNENEQKLSNEELFKVF